MRPFIATYFIQKFGKKEVIGSEVIQATNSIHASKRAQMYAGRYLKGSLVTVRAI